MSGTEKGSSFKLSLVSSRSIEDKVQRLTLIHQGSSPRVARLMESEKIGLKDPARKWVTWL